MLGVKNTAFRACIASNGRPSFTSISGQNEPNPQNIRENKKIAKMRKCLEHF